MLYSKIFIPVLIFLFPLLGFSQNELIFPSFNMTLHSIFQPESVNFFNDVWGYTDANGREYAILGAKEHIYFVDVTIPTQPNLIYQFNSNFSSLWRDFKTYKNYAYAVSDEGQEGLLIFDLSDLPHSISLVTQTNEYFDRAHNIQIDTMRGHLYAVGVPGLDDLTILDINNNSTTPTLVGNYDLGSTNEGVPSDGYIHDLWVKDGIVAASHINSGNFTLWNFRQELNTNESTFVPFEIARLHTSTFQSANWLTEDLKYAYYVEEANGAPIGIVDLQNITDFNSSSGNEIEIVNTFKYPLLESIGHTDNLAHIPFVKDNLLYISYWEDGVQVFDISDPVHPTHVAYLDTSPSNQQYSGTAGNWGVYPYFESGIIIASDVENGLFIMEMISNKSPLEVSISSTNTTCGAHNGSATVNITNGSGDYNIQWSNGATTPTTENLARGTYSVTVNDGTQQFIEEVTISFSEDFANSYEKIINNYIVNDLEFTTDGGIVMVGAKNSTSYISGEQDAHLIKLSSDGKTEWEHTIANTYCHDLEILMDGNIVVAGFQTTQVSDPNPDNYWWAGKLDNFGNWHWQNNYSCGPENSGVKIYSHDLYEIKTTLDGGFAFAGFGCEENTNFAILKINAAGEVEFRSSHGGANNDIVFSLTITPDQGFILGGTVNGLTYGQITKFDKAGNVEWSQNENLPITENILTTIDGGYVAYAPGEFIKLDADGNIVLRKEISNEQTVSAVVTPRLMALNNGNFLFLKNNTTLETLDTNGEVIDTYQYTEFNQENHYNILKMTPYGGIIVAGTTNNNPGDSNDLTTIIGLDASFNNASCQPSPVWPGDINNDGIVNPDDHQSFGLRACRRLDENIVCRTGPIRPNATSDFTPQPCSDWDAEGSKYYDCNGDGLIDSSTDIPIISLHYGKSHETTATNSIANNYHGNTQLRSQWNSFNSNNMEQYVLFDLHLEDLIDNQMEFYGIRFTVDYSALGTSAIASTEQSIMGSAADGLLTFYKDLGNGTMDISLVRSDGQNINTATGILCQIQIQLNHEVLEEELYLIFHNIKIIDNQGNESIAALGSSTTISFDNKSHGNRLTNGQNAPLSLLLNAAFIQDCNQGSMATATPLGGIEPYTYQWANGSTTAFAEQLSVGTHQVTVTDAAGQTVVGNIAVEGSCNTSLPLDLLTFDANIDEATVVLNWITLVENDSENFIIERSVNGHHFSKIGELKAKELGGNSYRFIDAKIHSSQTYYYRLKIVDQSRQFTYSPIRSIYFNTPLTGIRFSPNPVQDNLLLTFEQPLTENTELQIISPFGQVIQRSHLTKNTSEITLNMESFSTGLYFVTILQNNNRTTFKVLKE